MTSGWWLIGERVRKIPRRRGVFCDAAQQAPRNLSTDLAVVLPMFATALALMVMAGAALPAVTVETLAGKQAVLPRDLAQSTVLVAGFTKASRAQTEPWSRRLRADPRVSGQTRVYDVSILDGVPGFLRGMIISQMKSGISPERQKEFLIVTAEIASWKRALDAGEPGDDAYVILVQRTGAVIWRRHGSLTESSYQELLAAIDRLKRGQP
jgi:hypothetical protein